MTQLEKVQTPAAIGGISFFLARTGYDMPMHDAFSQFRAQLFQGGVVNHSEQRAAWHTEFRNPKPNVIVQDSLNAVRQLSQKIREKQWFFDVTDVVNIGIGGSDLGPKLICEAFANDGDGPNVHFVSNLDLTQIQSLLKTLSPKNTLFIATSKSFRTLETLENMSVAKAWLIEQQQDPAQHFIAITNNTALAVEVHQIPASQVLSMPEWMGGRYSVWSAVGLSCAITFGFEKWMTLHKGAHVMDQHFYQASTDENTVVQYALMMHEAIKHQQLKSLIVLPYTHALRSLPDYLQQLFMESLGKSVNQRGETVMSPTGPVVFGGTGTNSQHSFQQLMMQGTHAIFTDFIAPLDQAKVVANAVTQVKTLREGVDHEDPLKQIQGGKIANLFAIESLSLQTLGALLAFYEHVVVTLAFLMDINPFDQFGVEHGKKASEDLLQQWGGRVPTLEEIEGVLK